MSEGQNPTADPRIRPVAELPSVEARSWHVLPFSGDGVEGLDDAADAVANFVEDHPELAAGDVAYAFQRGERGLSHRAALLFQQHGDAIGALDERDPQRLRTALRKNELPVVFLFPGGGTQYVNMGVELYASEPVFRREIDRCAELFEPHLGFDLRGTLYPDPAHLDAAKAAIRRTSVALPALFSTSYAMAKLWLSWGVTPRAMLGHSLGEYVAANLSGVLTLDDAVLLVALRGRLIENLPGGAMLSVPMPEAEVRPLLGGLDIAAVNGPARCVVSGPEERVQELQAMLELRGHEVRMLAIKAAGHSTMVDPILDEFRSSLHDGLHLSSPTIPYLSNVTGTWATDAEALNPDYWVRHLRETVRFADGLATVRAGQTRQILLEAGPGRALTTLAAQAPSTTEKSDEQHLTSIPHPGDTLPASRWLHSTVSRLWLAGVRIDWDAYNAQESRQPVTLGAEAWELPPEDDD